MPSITRKVTAERASRRDEMRDRLLHTMEGLLAEGETFTEVSLERLVVTAGVARSTFYVYFGDKGDLMRSWLEAVTLDLDGSAERWLSLDEHAGRDDVRDALGTIIKTYIPYIPLMAAAFDAAAYDPGVRDATTAMMRHNIDGLTAHILVGQNAGFVDPGLRAEEVATWLMWMAERGFHLLIGGATEAERERLLDGYTSIVWNTLYATAPCRR
jgi:AcrR family transcriptional regulator